MDSFNKSFSAISKEELAQHHSKRGAKDDGNIKLINSRNRKINEMFTKGKKQKHKWFLIWEMYDDVGVSKIRLKIFIFKVGYTLSIHCDTKINNA